MVLAMIFVDISDHVSVVADGVVDFDLFIGGCLAGWFNVVGVRRSVGMLLTFNVARMRVCVGGVAGIGRRCQVTSRLCSGFR